MTFSLFFRTSYIMFPSQNQSALDIFNTFEHNDYCLFVAQMQSGKTGTYIRTAQLMLQAKRVSNIVVFSGNREKELRIQTQLRIQRDIISPFTSVVWGSSLHSFVPSSLPTLYIWDESHFAQSKGQAVHSFLTKCSLAPSKNGQNGNFFLSVSATPFSELHNIYPSNVVWMKHNPLYWGVKQMLRNQIVPYFKKDIFDIVKLYNSGYSLIRIYDSIIDFGLPFILYDSDFSQDIDSILAVKPSQHTIIFLKGKLQMGKTIIHQQFINFCMETCITKKTDSLLQGFIGRFCGYNTNHNTKIYIPSTIYFSGELQTYVNMFKGGKIPKKGMNLLLRTPTTKLEVFNSI